MRPFARKLLLWVVSALVGAFLVTLAAGCGGCGASSGKKLRLATTTSVVDSGLLALLLPTFQKSSGFEVEVASLGSGKSLQALHDGSADVALTHAPELELAAVQKAGVRRTPIMHNDFVIVGPAAEVGRVAGAGDFRDVLKAIAASGQKFVSRGDESGTHSREKELWQAAGLAPDASFIVSAKAGMAETLKRASDEGAFALADKATFLARRGDVALVIVFQGDDELRNVYSVIEPAGAAKADHAGARALAEFLRSPEGRAVIGGFGVKTLGEPLFTPEE